MVGLPRRRRRRAHEEADRGLQRRARRQDRDRGDDARLGHAVLHQGADLGRGRRGPGRDDLSRLAHSARPSARARSAEITADDMAAMGLDGRRLSPSETSGRGQCRRQAVCRAVRYASDRALLQQGHARGRRPDRRRRPARRASTASTTSRPRCRSSRTAAPSTASPDDSADGDFASSAPSIRCSASRTARS